MNVFRPMAWSAACALLVGNTGCSALLGDFDVGGNGGDASQGEASPPVPDALSADGPDATEPAETGTTDTGSDIEAASADSGNDAQDATSGGSDAPSDVGSDAPADVTPDVPADVPADVPSEGPWSTGGPSGSLAFTTSPTLGYSKVPLSQVVVSVKDTGGNAVSGVTVSLTLSAISGGLGALEGTASAASSAGLATFSNLDVSKSGLEYALVASASGYGTATSAPFEIDAWQPWNGNLAGGEVDVVAVSPTDPLTACAGTKSGVWRTADGGTTWKRVAFPDAQIYAIAAASDGMTVYAGNGSNGVYKSTDSGVTWNPANTGYASKSVGALAVVPGDPNTVYWGTNGGVLKTTNGGASWAQVFDGGDSGPNAYVSGVAIASSNVRTVYAGVPGGSVYKSVDAGGSWSNMGPFGALTTAFVKPLIVDATSSDTVYAGLQNGQGVWKSTGGAFTQLGATTDPIYGCGTTSMAIDTKTNTIYANCYESGVYVTTNGGGMWTVTGPQPRGINNYALDIAASSPSTLYVGYWPGDGGVAKTVNGGTTWTSASGGFAAYDVHGLVVTHSGSILVGGGYLGAGVMVSTDGGNTYTANASPNYIGDLSLAASPFSDATIYAGIDGYALYTSVNTAGSFAIDMNDTGTKQIAPSPASANTIYSVGNTTGCFATTNGGTSWTNVVNPTSYSYAYGNGVAAHPTIAGTAIAGLGDGVYLTTNSGASWQRVSQPSVFEGWVTYDASGKAYAAGYVVGSSPDGMTWTDITGAAPLSSSNPAGMIQAHTVSGVPIVYLGVGSRGLWRLIGGTWTQSGMEGLQVSAFAIDPTTPTTQYTGTLGNGIYRSLSGGD
jgi:photosystem II stability/assembly factor-like uncharacterized protein